MAAKQRRCIDAVRRVMAENTSNPNAAVYFVGHSLGGGLAQFATFDYKQVNNDVPVGLVTFNAFGWVGAIAQGRSITTQDIASTVAGVDAMHIVVRDDMVGR